MAENGKTVAKTEVKEYFTGDYDNAKFEQCRTRFKHNDTIHRVFFYLPVPRNDAEAQDAFGCNLEHIIRLGVTNLSYKVNSKAVFEDPASWDGDQLTPAAIKAIQEDADSIVAEKPKKERAKKVTKAQVQAEIAAEAGFDSYEDFQAAMAKIKAKKK